MKRSIFFISDGTGITSETLGHSLLAQFTDLEYEQFTLPYIDNLTKAYSVVEQINLAATTQGVRPLLFDTIVNQDIRSIIAQANAFKIDVFSSFLKPLENELNMHSNFTVGKSHGIMEYNRYKNRIDSVNFAMNADDGLHTSLYPQADIILTGVSRCGKTPTCLYMAMQFGIKAANYPLTEDKPSFNQLPSILKRYQDKLYGLSINPLQLSSIRHERCPDTNYSTLRQCEFEVSEVEQLFDKLNVPFINTTNFSIEEISTKIMAKAGLKRSLI